jgi:hypothetical protein
MNTFEMEVTPAQAKVVVVARLLWKLPTYTSMDVPSSAQIATTLEWSRDIIERVVSVTPARTKFTSSPIQLAVCAHIMAGEREALNRYIAFRSLEFDDMSPAAQSFVKQIVSKKASTRHTWELAARAWRAFSSQSQDASRVLVKDVSVPLAEMEKAVSNYRQRLTRKK